MIHSRPHLRALLGNVLKADSDLDAFCGDYFPNVRKRFTSGMDQIAKITLLLDYAKPVSIVEALHEAHPEFMRELEQEQKARPESYSALAELGKVRDGAEPSSELGQPLAAPGPPPQPALAASNPSPAGAIPSLPADFPAVPGATAAPIPAVPGATTTPFPAAPSAPVAPVQHGSAPRRALLAVTIAAVLVVGGISGVIWAVSRPSSTPAEDPQNVVTREVPDSVDVPDLATSTHAEPVAPPTVASSVSSSGVAVTDGGRSPSAAGKVQGQAGWRGEPSSQFEQWPMAAPSDDVDIAAADGTAGTENAGAPRNANLRQQRPLRKLSSSDGGVNY